MTHSYVCDMTYLFVWHDAFIRVWHDSFECQYCQLIPHSYVCVTWLICMSDMTHSYMCDMTYSYVCNVTYVYRCEYYWCKWVLMMYTCESICEFSRLRHSCIHVSATDAYMWEYMWVLWTSTLMRTCEYWWCIHVRLMHTCECSGLTYT